MRSVDMRQGVFLMTVVLAAAISGCGGSSNTRMDTDSGMTGGTDTGMTGGTDTGMTGGVQMLTVPDSMARSTVTPVYATNADSFGSVGPETSFPALSALINRDFGASTLTLEDAPLDGAVHFSISDDDDAVAGDEEIVVTVVFQDGEELEIEFTSDDYVAEDEGWMKEIDGERFWFWFWTREFRHFMVVATEFPDGSSSDWINSTFGARTSPAAMPAGTATYVGSARADSWPDDAPSGSLPTRQRIFGDLRLAANFANSTLDGRITGIEVRRGGESERSDWPATTYFSIDDGKIVDGQFTAALTGEDSNANAAMDESLSGYEGSVLGEFYGPAAEEVGGVFTASRDGRALVGWLGGAQLDPDRLAATPRTPVSVGVDRDFGASTSQLTDAARVTAVESDGADGFHLTYMIDGTSQRIHLPVSGYDPSDRQYTSQQGPPEYGIWEQANSYQASSEFDYFSVNGWYYWNYEIAGDGSRTTLDTSRGHMVYGDPTAALPSGTADYTGQVYMNGWSRTDPSSSNGRARFRGSLALTADFDGGTIGGSLDGWGSRGPGESDYSGVDSEVLIRNGTITNNQLSADLIGMREAAGFTGNMTGRFFGPGAAEVGGVIDGESTGHVFEGWFGGKKQ